MPFDPARHHRRSIRLRGYDYSQAGAYFVTICSQGRDCLFGSITGGAVALSPAGERVAAWEDLPARYPGVDLDAWVLMPNHLHGILVLHGPQAGPAAPGGPADGPVQAPPSPPAAASPVRQPTLGQLVAAFKYLSTKAVNLLRETPGRRMWQRNYYDHVIRDDEDLDRLRQYTAENPLRWELDTLNPEQPSPW
jgi:REP element-mobilizing transposase RayT